MFKKKILGGFTLIELLVVISIIALLLSIVVPALSKVKKRAQKVVCRTNLSQLGLSVNVFCQSNKRIGWLVWESQSYPVEFNLNDGSSKLNRVVGDWWHAALAKGGYFKNYELIQNGSKIVQGIPQGILKCPSVSIKSASFDWNKWKGTCYAMNDHLCRSYLKQDTMNPKRHEQVSSPSTKVLFSEHGDGENNSIPVLNGFAKPVLRHEGKVNVFYLDGHVDELSTWPTTDKYNIRDRQYSAFWTDVLY